MTQVKFDNSLLGSTYCTTRAVLRHVHGLTTQRDEQKTQAGRSAHEALAVYFQGGTIEAAMMVFEGHYKGAAPQEPGDRLSYENTSTILQTWLETHPLDSLPFEVLPELVEVPFEIPFTNECVCGHAQERHQRLGPTSRIYSCRTCHAHGTHCTEFTPAFVFTGRMDLIVRAKDTGKLLVLDHKTTGMIDASQYRNDSQMSGYVWAGKQTGHEVAGAYINFVGFSLLPGMKGNGHYKCRTHKRMEPNGRERAAVYDECRTEHCKFEMPLKTRSPEQLEVWRLSALSLAERYREMSTKYSSLESVALAPMEGTFYFGGCRYCPFSDFCISGRPMQWAESMLIHSPWSPLV